MRSRHLDRPSSSARCLALIPVSACQRDGYRVIARAVTAPAANVAAVEALLQSPPSLALGCGPVRPRRRWPCLAAGTPSIAIAMPTPQPSPPPPPRPGDAELRRCRTFRIPPTIPRRLAPDRRARPRRVRASPGRAPSGCGTSASHPAAHTAQAKTAQVSHPVREDALRARGGDPARRRPSRRRDGGPHAAPGGRPVHRILVHLRARPRVRTLQVWGKPGGTSR